MHNWRIDHGGFLESGNTAYTTIKNKILSFEYTPGFQLKEIPLAEELNLTRTPIRKAIVKLENEGLVKTYPHRGAFVVSLSWEEVEEIFEVREALEIKAASLAIRRASREELDRVQTALDKRESAVCRTKPKYVVPDIDFHQELIKLSKNGILISMWMGLHSKLQLIRIQSSMIGGRFLAAIREHKKILSCIYDNKLAETEQRLRTHIQNAKPDLRVTSRKD